MALSEAFFLEQAKSNIWIALRTDQIRGDGSARNPYNGGLSLGPANPVELPAIPVSSEVIVNLTRLTPQPHCREQTGRRWCDRTLV